MSAKRQIAEALDALPESLSVEEALERLIRAFKLKRALAGARAEGPRPTSAETAEAARIIDLLNEERIDEARELAQKGADPRWASVLAPAQVYVATAASGHGLTDQAHAAFGALDGFVGQWVALREGGILDAAPRRAELHRRVEAAGLLDGTVFMKVEE